MKSLVKFIIETSKTPESWNRKFYTNKEGKTSIYLDDVQHDVTELYEATRKADGFVYASEITSLYSKSISDLIELEFDLEMEDITNEEFEAKKQEIINAL